MATIRLVDAVASHVVRVFEVKLGTRISNELARSSCDSKLKVDP